MATRFEELIDRSAAPDAVRVALRQLDDRHGQTRALIAADTRIARRFVAVTAASRSLTRLLLRRPELIEDLVDLDARPRLPEPTEGADALVTWKQQEYLRIAARDLTGLDRLEDTGAALSTMAADVLNRACALATGHSSCEGLAVVGMGKLGGAELNYASDVDIMFVLSDDHESTAIADTDERQRQARTVIEIASRCFRVDTALRPEGRDGPLVRSLDSYEAYWERWAEAWEFQALLKARPVAGDPSLQQRFEEAASQHLWSRPFTADDLRAVRSMKRRTEEFVSRRHNGERDLKRAPGGLRDIEFSVQLLQLVHGHHDSALRTRGTLAALAELGAAGYIASSDAEWLDRAYRFLRRVEHRLQLEDDQQVHAVPATTNERRRLARVVGFRDSPQESALDAFERELAACRATVRRLHEELYFRPLLERFADVDTPLSAEAAATRLAVFGFTDVDRTREAVVELTRGLTRSSRLMQQFMPLLLDWLSETPDPDLGLLGLRRVASERVRADQLAVQFRDSPEIARRLCMLLGTSRELGDLLVRNSDLIAGLCSTTRFDHRGRAEMLDEARAALGLRHDTRQRRRALKRFRERELLRIAAHDVFGTASINDVGAALTRLAQVTIEAALDWVRPELPFSVVALGRFGGQALSYASDLDVLFVYDGDTPTDFQTAIDAATQLLRFLEGPSPAQRIWRMDASLRPEGRDGPLARSLDGFRVYFERWAQTWERQAMVLATPAAGDIELGERFIETLKPFVWRGLTAAEAREIRRMKARVERERIPVGQDPEFHLKLGRGSLSDVEWTAQLLQLEHGIHAAGTLDALGRLVTAGHLAPADGEILDAAYRFCEHTRNRLFLVDGRGDALPSRPDRLAVLARSLGTTGPALREEYRRVTRRARRVAERVFYGQQ